MSQFTTPLIVTPTDDGRWVLQEAFEYHVGHEDSDEVITVPAGFVTDFASIPKFLWSIFPPYHPTYGKAAVLHDHTYATQTYTRKRADQIFLEAMIVLLCRWWRRTIIYQSVRWFAGGAWKMHGDKLSTAKTVADVLEAKRTKDK